MFYVTQLLQRFELDVESGAAGAADGQKALLINDCILQKQHSTQQQA